MTSRVVDLNADVLAIGRLRATAVLPVLFAMCCGVAAFFFLALERDGWKAALALVCSAAFLILVGRYIERVDALGVDDEVHREIGLRLPLGVDAIGLKAIRVEEDVTGGPPIVKGIEIHADDVIVCDCVTAGESGSQPAGCAGCPERQIERAALKARPWRVFELV